MFGDFALIGVLLLLVSCSVGMALLRLSRHRRLTILDTKTMLRHVDAQKVREMLYPQIEFALSTEISRKVVREMQIEKLYHLREAFLRMLHNAFVFTTLAHSQVQRETEYEPSTENRDRHIELGRDLYGAAMEFRLYAFLTLLRIHFWLVFRSRPWCPLRLPQISDLRSIGALRFTASYSRQFEAAKCLYLEHGPEFYEYIAELA